MKHYYSYQITNLLNNKIYVGTHKTKNLKNGYIGLGKVLKNAIENFKKYVGMFINKQKS